MFRPRMTSKTKKAPLKSEQKRALEEAWLEQNRAAIRAHNERIEKHGTMLKPIWLPETD